MPERKASPRAKTGEGKPTPRKRTAKKAAAKPASEPKADVVEPKVDEPKNPDPTWPKPAPPDHPGFVGAETDPTPNENYSIAGVTGNLPTPENDEDAAAAARKL